MNKYSNETTLILCTFALLVSGCSDSTDKFKVFEEVKSNDDAGIEINCEELVSLLDIHEIRTGSLISSSLGEVAYDVLDFTHKTGYEFKQCRKELELKRLNYCDSRIDRALETAVDNVLGNEPGKKFYSLCSNEYAEATSGVGYTYQLPTTEKPMLHLESLGVFIEPSSINQISYGSLDQYLWYIKLHTPEGSYKLFYGSQEKLDSAIDDFSSIAGFESEIAKTHNGHS
ncbi:hypothetical protein OCT63_17025 [Vibrio sp. RW]|uniref:hypothetical protein n=1 Tax=Vibrio sp. RW TaxID=2998833 RepID=UPI0022CD4961|nr:hypothetical protein [Vibrio sp. RW]MDA0145930.1 hypothetical protein [Vibrio sp. RW]